MKTIEPPAAPADPARTRALSVSDALRARIFDGRIAPGSHIMEVSLAQELGVSRTPVRDALARLAEEGLLIYQPNRGFLVRRFDVKDVHDSTTLRATLEGMSCRIVSERGLGDAGRERLLGQLAAQREVLYGDTWSETSASRWQDLNLDFHYTLLELADNRWLADAVRRSRHLPLVYDSRSRPHDLSSLRLLYLREHSRQAHAEHVRIVDALIRRETARAEALMQEHILHNRDVLVRALRSEPAEAAAVAQDPWPGAAAKKPPRDGSRAA